MRNPICFDPKPCPESGNGVHSWLYHAACCAVDAEMTDREAVEIIESLMTRDPASASEIEDALQSARGERRPSRRWSPANPSRIAPISKEGPTLLELVSQSPVPIRFGERSRTEEIIDALFPGNPWLCVGRSDRDFYTERREFWRGKLEERSLIVPSPMSSQRGLTKQGKLSCHSLENTGSRRFLVIEFDRGSLDQQAALLWHLKRFALLALVVFSSNKSIHSWFFCAGQPEDKLKRFFDYAHSLGADSRMWTRSQFARLPDGMRSDGKTSEALKDAGVGNVAKGKQAVLYFNPGVVQ
jgi:hypothetical protein